MGFKKIDAEVYAKGVKDNKDKYVKNVDAAKGDWATQLKPISDQQIVCATKIKTGEITGLGAYASCMAETFPAKNY